MKRVLFSIFCFVGLSAQDFQLTTYNVLAPTYASINGGEWYAHIDPRVMDWEMRQEAIIDRLQSLESDVYCLQEIEPEFFVRLQQELDGYWGLFLNKDGPGEAILFREVFQLLGADRVVAQDGRQGQLALLRIGDTVVGVINGHLSWDELGEKCNRQIRDWVAQIGDEENWIICGDFNVTRTSPAILYLEEIGFRRAYEGCEPAVTCSVPSAAHEVDFILYRGSLLVTKVMPVREVGALPSLEEPSDHLPKTAVFHTL